MLSDLETALVTALMEDTIEGKQKIIIKMLKKYSPKHIYEELKRTKGWKEYNESSC